MYLMYYTDDQGKRVYTLKVRARGAGADGRAGSAGRALRVCHGCGGRRRPRRLGRRRPGGGRGLRCGGSGLTDAAALVWPRDACGFPPTVPLVRLPQKDTPEGASTTSAHPARFSPDDKFSKQRVAGKKRFNLLPTQQEAPAF